MLGKKVRCNDCHHACVATMDAGKVELSDSIVFASPKLRKTRPPLQLIGVLAGLLLAGGIVFAIVLGLRWTGTGGAGEYAIKLTRPMKVGDHREFVLSHTLKPERGTTVGEGAPQTQKSEVQSEVEGTAEVLAIDDKGRATKDNVTLARCTKTTEGRKAELVAAGSTVLVEKKGAKTVAEAKYPEQSLSPEAKEVLESLLSESRLSASNPAEATWDETMGTTKKQKVGDSWDCNAAVCQKEYARAFGCQVEDFKGKVTLDKVTNVDGVEYMDLAFQEACKARPPWVPLAAKVEKAEFNASYIIRMPVDITVSGTLSFEFTARWITVYKIPGQDGKEVTVRDVCEDSSSGSSKMKKM
jgi:DNA-binding protein YbaB